MDNSYFDSENYNQDKHWHIECSNEGQSIEAIAFQRNHSDLWDVFFNGFIDDTEYAEITRGSAVHRDPIFGVFLFAAHESDVISSFQFWVKNVLMPYRI